MTSISKAIAKTLAGGIVFAALCAPASALDIGSRSSGLGVSVDTSSSNGLGLDVGATVGGSGGVNADVNADIGGSKGLADAKANASVGGSSGLTGVGANVGLGGNTLADIGINIGGPGIAGPGGPGGPSGPGGPGINPGVIGGMSQAQVAAYVKRCKMVLSNPGAFESDLRELCKLLRTASR